MTPDALRRHVLALVTLATMLYSSTGVNTCFFSLSLSETRVQASWNPAKECADHAADVGAHGYTSSHNLESAWPPRSHNVNFLVGGAASQGDIPEGLE